MSSYTDMLWTPPWRPMNTAPLGRRKERTTRMPPTKKHPEGYDVKRAYHVGKRILTASKCGKVLESWWIEPTENTKGRWNLYSAEEEPIGWMHLPVHPYELEKTRENGEE